VLAMQSEEDARRIVALGADQATVFVTGNLKTDAASDPPQGVDEWRRLLGLEAEQLVWVAGSTHRGEEAMVLDAHEVARRAHADLKLILAPRHPERVEEVVGLIRARGGWAIRRSELPAARSRDGIVVLDTLGELAPLYAVADVVFIGGSLVGVGGHNTLEAALRRKPVLSGPNTHNFREATALLEGAGAMMIVRGVEGLARSLLRLLADGELRVRMGTAGYEAVVARHGAVRKTLQLVTQLLGSESPAR